MKSSKRVNHQERILTIVGSVMLIIYLYLSPCYGQQRVALPDEWWCQPTWSPDSRLIAVQSPPPTKVPFKGKDGETHYGYTEPPDRKTLILQARDYQVLASIDQAIWPTWSPNGKFLAAETWDKNDFHHFVAVYDAASGSRIKKFNVDLP
ncbi:MAG: hypothetical protein K2X93_25870, partial [Candidatus Obscuribacterales bacterium]|nr:hypothetical protein [Candidatus Obscuribacterales bacterium]